MSIELFFRGIPMALYLFERRVTSFTIYGKIKSGGSPSVHRNLAELLTGRHACFASSCATWFASLGQCRKEEIFIREEHMSIELIWIPRSRTENI